MLNEKTKGVAIAAISAGAALGVGRAGAAREVEQLEKLAKVEKAAPTVTAELKVNGRTFFDTNQTARASELADANKTALISERIARKHAKAVKKAFTKGLPEPNPIPNGNRADAHAETGAIQQAHEAGVVKGADMHITVTGRNVCGYCKGDIPAIGNTAEIRSMMIDATDELGK